MAETTQAALYSLIYETVREIPAGKVATYGQIARLIGLPRHARHVGFALAHLSGHHGIPWHRVVNARGELHSSGRHRDQHIRLLQDEGILVSEKGNIKLNRYQWQPGK